MTVKPITILEKSVLPMGIITFASVIIPIGIILFSTLNPNLLYPEMEQIQPWQWQGAGGLSLVYGGMILVIWAGGKK